MNENNTPVYEWSNAIEYIANRCNLSRDIIEHVLELEEDYMRSIGIITEDAVDNQELFNVDGTQRNK